MASLSQGERKRVQTGTENVDLAPRLLSPQRRRSVLDPLRTFRASALAVRFWTSLPLLAGNSAEPCALTFSLCAVGKPEWRPYAVR